MNDNFMPENLMPRSEPPEHRCEFEIAVNTDTNEVIAWCECDMIIEAEEITRILNEHETLKRATDTLSAEDAMTVSFFIVPQGNMEDRLQARLRDYARILGGEDETNETK